MMKLPGGELPHKVCCPHCRHNIVPGPVEPGSESLPSQPDGDLISSSVSGKLQEILSCCREKRSLLSKTTAEISALEKQMNALSILLREQDLSLKPPEKAAVELQTRLFDQLLTLEKGCIDILDCDSPQEASLAAALRLTFEASGWAVRFSQAELNSHCGEEITFVVAPGQVNYQTAAVYMALQIAGARLHSQIDLSQPENHPLLCVHRISQIPKLLPTPVEQQPGPAAQPFRKTA